MSFDTKGAARLALIGLAVASLAACTSRPKPTGPVEPTPPAQPQAPQQPYTPPAPVPDPTPQGPLPGTIQDFVVNVGDRVYFDTDEYSVRADAQPVLAGQAQWLNRYQSVRVRIEGNADERGTREYNLALGARRANAVREFLIGQGVAASRIETISFGKERPLDPGTDETAWAKNRNARTAITDGAR